MDRIPATAAPVAVPELTGGDAYLIGEAGSPQAQSGFEMALRGYNRRQVDRYVVRAQRHIDELSAELAVMTRRERDLSVRADELAEAIARCTCGPETPPSAILGVRLRQILDLALAEAADVRTQAQADSQALRQEAEGIMARARADAARATADFEAVLERRRAAEAATAAERRAAVDNRADRQISDARETARRLIEHAAAVSGQVVASARWLVDALGAHRDALTEQLGGVSRRIQALPSLEAAVAIAAVSQADADTVGREADADTVAGPGATAGAPPDAAGTGGEGDTDRDGPGDADRPDADRPAGNSGWREVSERPTRAVARAAVITSPPGGPTPVDSVPVDSAPVPQPP